MPTPTLTQLFTPLTADQVFASELDIAAQVQLPVTAWQELSCGREVLFVTAQLASNFTVGAFAGAAAGGLLDFATGDWLTLLAISNFGVTRIPATFGAGIEEFTNVAAVDYDFAAGELVLINSVTGATYTNAEDVHFPAGSVSVPTVTPGVIIAQTAGTTGNAAVGQVTSLQSPVLGLSVTNTTVIAGVDEQSDPSLRTLCRLSMARASPNGPVDAYSYFAVTSVRLVDGASVGVTRTNVIQQNGTVIVYVASASGGVTGDASDPNTDLGAVNANIQNNCVPTGITAATVSATPFPQTITAEVWRARGSTIGDDALKQAINNQLIAYVASVPIGGFNIGTGGTLFLDAIIGQIFQAAPGQVVQVTVSIPAADVAVNSNQVVTLGTVTITVNQAP